MIVPLLWTSPPLTAVSGRLSGGNSEVIGFTVRRPQPKTRANLFALFGQKGPTERDAQLAGINAICGTTYTSRSHLTDTHAQQVIAALRKRPDLTPAEVPA